MTNATAHNLEGAASETTAALSLMNLSFDEYGQAPVPTVLRPKIGAIVEALVSKTPEKNLKTIRSVHFKGEDIAISLKNISAYPAEIVFVDEVSWQTSVITQEGKCLIDLSTSDESPSDLVLHLKYAPKKGIDVGMIYVP